MLCGSRRYRFFAGIRSLSAARNTKRLEGLAKEALLKTGMSPAVRNLTSVISAEVIAKLMGIVGVVYLARVLRPEGLGVLSFAITAAAYSFVLVNFGFNDYGVLHVAPDRSGENVRAQLGKLLPLRLCLALASYSLLIVLSFVVPAFHQIQALLLLLGMTVFLQALSIEWLFTAVERMEFIAIARIAGGAAYLVLLFVFVRSRGDVLAGGAVTVAQQLVTVLLLLFFAALHYGVAPPRASAREWRRIGRFVLPIGLSGIAAQMYFNVDVLVLGFLRPAREVGYYAAAMKIIAVGIAFKLLVGQVFYPKVVRFTRESKNKLRRSSMFVQKYCIVVGLLIGSLGTFLGRMVIPLVFGPDFAPSVLVFQITIWVVALEFAGMAFPYAVLASNRRAYAMIIGSAVAVNIALNLVLIPLFGIVGAGIAYVTSSVCVVAAAYVYVNRAVVRIPVAPLFARPLIAACISMAGMAAAGRSSSLVLTGGVGIGLYASALFAQKMTPAQVREDFRAIR